MKTYAFWGVSAAAMAVAAPAFAKDESQSAMPESASHQGVGDIVVTAQRREESAQRAALSIDVFSGDDLRSQGIAQPDDLTRIAPGLEVSGGNTTQVYVRGVGDFGVTATANPGVAVSLDGVYIARPQVIAGNFYDLQRVELLKGPQGTLYGRGATGGALNLLTAAPEPGEFSGYVEGNFGNFDLWSGEAAINIPTGDNGAFRLSGQVVSRDGYLSDGADDEESQSFRLQYLVEADRLSFRALGAYSHLGGTGGGLAVKPAIPGTDPWTGNHDPIAGAAYIQAAGDQFNAALAGGCDPSPPPDGNCPVPPALLADQSQFAPFRDVDSYTAQMQIDYDFDFATLTFIPAYRRSEMRFGVTPSFFYNVGGAYSFNGDSTEGETSDQYSAELRLGGETGPLTWVVGGYWFKEDQFADYALQGGLILNQRVTTEFESDVWALFGQGTFEVTDTFRVTGGLRYTSDERAALNLQKFAISPAVTAPNPVTGNPPIPCLPDVPAPGANPPATLCPLLNTTPGYYDSNRTFNELTWKVGVEFDVGPNSLLYADVSTGFKAGGFNVAISLTDPTSLSSFEPEEITAYSIGIKNRFLNNQLQFNVEAFYWDYTNLQLSAQAIDGVGSIVLLTQNAGEATVMGIEADMIARLWPGGTLRGSVAWVDSEYDAYTIDSLPQFAFGRFGCPISAPNTQGIVTIDCSGQPLIRSPEFSGNVGFSQAFDLSNGGNVTLDGDMAFSSSRVLATDFIPEQFDAGFVNLSASLTYTAPDENWFISAWIRNITDEVIYTGGGGHQAAFVNGWVTSTIAPPRTYGLRAGVRF